MSAILAGHVTQIRTMADGSPRLTVDFACTLAELVAVVGGVGQSVAVAALAPDSQPQPGCTEFDELADTFSTQNSENCVDGDTPKGGSRARQAAMICQNPEFQSFAASKLLGYSTGWAANAQMESVARDLILSECQISSRAELDHKHEAWLRFQAVMSSFNAWKSTQSGGVVV